MVLNTPLSHKLNICHCIQMSIKIQVIIEEVGQRCSVVKVCLEISQSSQENTYARMSFIIKLQVLGLQLYLLWHRCFPGDFVKFLRTLYFTEHFWWLLLYLLLNGQHKWVTNLIFPLHWSRISPP